MTDVLRPCHARFKPQGKPRCACLERPHLKPGRFFVPEDGVEEQEKCRKRIKTDAHDNPFVAAGKLAGWILQGSTQSQGKAARCACLARLHLRPWRFSVPGRWDGGARNNAERAIKRRLWSSVRVDRRPAFLPRKAQAARDVCLERPHLKPRRFFVPEGWDEGIEIMQKKQ